MKDNIYRIATIVLILINEAIWFNQMFLVELNEYIFMLLCVALFTTFIIINIKYDGLFKKVTKNNITLESILLIVYLTLMLIPAVMLPLGYVNSSLNDLTDSILQINHFARMLSLLNPGILLIILNAYYLIKQKRNKPKV